MKKWGQFYLEKKKSQKRKTLSCYAMFPQYWRFQFFFLFVCLFVSFFYQEMCLSPIFPGDPPRKVLLHRFPVVSACVVLHHTFSGGHAHYKLFPKSILHFGGWVERTTPWPLALESSDVVIDKSADSNGSYLLQFSPSGPGRTLKWPMFKFLQTVFAALPMAPFAWMKGSFLPFCGFWAPQGEHSIGPMVTYSASLRGRWKLCSSPLYGPNMDCSSGPAWDCGWWHHKLNIPLALLI